MSTCSASVSATTSRSRSAPISFTSIARHHSLALIETGKNGMHHLMVELFSLDDVGQAYDIALSEPERVSVTLGRHTNDLMTSFYAKTPSSFMVECGWGGREIEPPTWQPFEMHHGPSLWGHERVWLPPATARSHATCGCDAAARRPARAGAGDGRQLQADVGDLRVVGRGEAVARHCEERLVRSKLKERRRAADKAIQTVISGNRPDCFAPLAMTKVPTPDAS